MMCSEHDITHKLYDEIDQLELREEEWCLFVHTSTTSPCLDALLDSISQFEQGHVLMQSMNHVVYIT